MSWDALLVRVKGGDDAVEIWEAEEVPLGSRKAVLDAIKTEFPAIEQQSRSEFTFIDGDLSIEFKLMGRGPIAQVMLEVRGQGDPLTPLLRLATTNGWRVFDISTSAYINPKKPRASSGYGEYRKAVKRIATPKRSKRPKN